MSASAVPATEASLLLTSAPETRSVRACCQQANCAWPRLLHQWLPARAAHPQVPGDGPAQSHAAQHGHQLAGARFLFASSKGRARPTALELSCCVSAAARSLECSATDMQESRNRCCDFATLLPVGAPAQAGVATGALAGGPIGVQAQPAEGLCQHRRSARRHALSHPDRH